MHKIYSQLNGFTLNKFRGCCLYNADSIRYDSTYSCAGIDLKSAYRDGNGYGDGHFEGNSIGSGAGCGIRCGLDEGGNSDKLINFYFSQDA